MKTINIGICGLGTVGSGVVNVFTRNLELIKSRVDCNLHITHIGARRDNPLCDTSGIRVSRDIFDVVDDPNVDIIVELIGGTDIAKKLVLKALAAGKHVVTANKALIATFGNDLVLEASRNQVCLCYEAAVAGGIPVIKALREGLSANQIQSIAGIINGTGNFILTEMSEKKRDFTAALADAQKLGYAEADPTFDVEGIDAAQKLVILAALAFNVPFDTDACFTEGISKVNSDDVEYAKELGYHIKHLGITRKSEEGLELRVHPTLIPSTQLLSQVRGVMNAVSISGDAVGPTLYYGAGAGSEATASAVLADVIDIAKRVVSGAKCNAENTLKPMSIPIVPIGDVHSAYYLRIDAVNQPGVLSNITKLLSDLGISVEAMRQCELSFEKDNNKSFVPIVITTNVVKESHLRTSVKQIEELEVVKGNVVFIRIESLA